MFLTPNPTTAFTVGSNIPKRMSPSGCVGRAAAEGPVGKAILNSDIERVVSPDARGDPPPSLRWTTTSLKHVAQARSAMKPGRNVYPTGIKVSDPGDPNDVIHPTATRE